MIHTYLIIIVTGAHIAARAVIRIIFATAAFFQTPAVRTVLSIAGAGFLNVELTVFIFVSAAVVTRRPFWIIRRLTVAVRILVIFRTTAVLVTAQRICHKNVFSGLSHAAGGLVTVIAAPLFLVAPAGLVR